MIIPYKDINPTNNYPYVTIALIVANVLVFAGQFLMEGSIPRSVSIFGFRPVSLTQPLAASDAGAPALLTIFLSMFMHAGILHIGFNMLYLWIYGDNIEDVMGHTFFAAFYILAGLVAILAHTIFHLGSDIPTVGASGAVAGILGAYLVLYPKAQVKTFIWMFLIYMTVILVPAWVLIGFFVMTNVIMGAVSLTAEQPAGVAYFAHLGGLAFGVLLALPFRNRLRYARKAHARFDNWPSEWRI